MTANWLRLPGMTMSLAIRGGLADKTKQGICFFPKRRMKMQKTLALMFTMLLATTLATLVLAAPAVASTATYRFDLIGPQTAEDSSTNDNIAMTGSGSFDPSANNVVASGNFAIFSASGSELSAGKWEATKFLSFDAFGGPNSGEQGGVLDITVTLFPAGGSPITNVSLKVTCLINAPKGFTGKEGVTVSGAVGSFTDSARGRTLFHLNQ